MNTFTFILVVGLAALSIIEYIVIEHFIDYIAENHQVERFLRWESRKKRSKRKIKGSIA